MRLNQNPVMMSVNRMVDGFSLIELSVMILVMFSFISMLFIGARAWKRGADRAQCVMNIRNMQLAVRGFANSNDLDGGDNLTLIDSHGVAGSALIGSGNFLPKMPECPGMGIYTIHGNTVPATGVLYMTCSLAAQARHAPDMHGTW